MLDQYGKFGKYRKLEEEKNSFIILPPGSANVNCLIGSLQVLFLILDYFFFKRNTTRYETNMKMTNPIEESNTRSELI